LGRGLGEFLAWPSLKVPWGETFLEMGPNNSPKKIKSPERRKVFPKIPNQVMGFQP